MNDSEILPPFGRLNDIEKGLLQKILSYPKIVQNSYNKEKLEERVTCPAIFLFRTFLLKKG